MREHILTILTQKNIFHNFFQVLVRELYLSAGQLIHPVPEAGTELEPLEVPDLLAVPVSQAPQQGEDIPLGQAGPGHS